MDLKFQQRRLVCNTLCFRCARLTSRWLFAFAVVTHSLGAQSPSFNIEYSNVGNCTIPRQSSNAPFSHSIGPCSETTDVPGVYIVTQTFTGAARASFNGLGAAATLSLDGFASGPVSTFNGPFSRVQASASDRLSFGGGSGTGVFRVTQTISGNFTDSKQNQWVPRNRALTMSSLSGGGAFQQSFLDGSFPGPVTTVTDFTFQFGQLSDFDRTLILDVGWAGSFWDGQMAASATGDFLNSADFSYEVLDGQFRPIAGATVTGADGYVYAVGSTVVPEPGTSVLMVLGVLGVLALGRRQRSAIRD